ncbi:MAG: SLC13 family permease [Gammaproteobacteria bacterium]
MSDSTLVFSMIGIIAILMVSGRVRFDAIALIAVLVLIVSGVLSIPEALAGFGSSVVITIAGLLIIGEMLDRTGVARAVGDMILRRGGNNETQLLVLIMVSAGILGSVMSSTAIVAIFIPIVLRIAAETNLAASRILIPMSYAALISGMMTLIATAPNLVVNAELISAGHSGFRFFSFSLIGLAILAVAVTYMVVFGRRLLSSKPAEESAGPRRSTSEELWLQYRSNDQVEGFVISANSPLEGRQLDESGLIPGYDVRPLSRVRRDRRGQESVSVVSPGTHLQHRDVLIVAGEATEFERLSTEQKLRRFRAFWQSMQHWRWETGMAAALIHPESGLIGQTVVENQFLSRYGVQVIGLRRGGAAIAGFEHEKLQAGDSLLLHGYWSKIDALNNYNHEFVVMDIPREHDEVVPAYKKAPVAVGILAVMVLLTVLDVVPLVVAVLGAALAAVFTGCLSAAHAYRSIHWSSLVLVAGMMPLGDALQQTGGSAMIVEELLDVFGEARPTVMLVVIFALTALLSMVLSNTASAVLAAPIAITAAQSLGVSPYPFAIAVLIAASAAYSTPVSSPVVTLVVEPGRYAFLDFVKVGVPLLVLTCLVTILIAPLLFPF